MDSKKATGLFPHGLSGGGLELPPPAARAHGASRLRRRRRGLRFVGLACLSFIAYAQWRQLSAASSTSSSSSSSTDGITAHGLSVRRLHDDLATCARLHTVPADPIGPGRERNDRYVDGQRPTLIRNATVWVGEPAEGTSPEDAHAGRGYAWTAADVFLEHGLVRHVGRDLPRRHRLPADTLVYDAAGRPLTSGLIDMHSHAGVDALPSLRGNADFNEVSSDITPYVRAIDGVQPRDHQIQVIKSGGVTASLVLPGSANNIGGEAYVLKHAVGRRDGRNETSAADMLADPARTWRYMKSACGENPKNVYGGGRPGAGTGPTSRLGESWAFRHAYEQAARLVRAQDDWCAAAAAPGGLHRAEGYLPQELRWEALAALLRGQVLLHVHCYTIPDLEAFVDHTREFNFTVRAFHHAHQTYLVPEILKRTWGPEPPASALFADNMWYKAESYEASVHAGKRLHDSGLVPIYVSDNPVLNAQHLVLEAAKAYRYGLPYHAALASVTTAPAHRLGLGRRLGKVKPGFDADVVVWDSDPLSVGATPVQVWIDGTAQFERPVELVKKPYAGPPAPDATLGRDVVEDPSAAAATANGTVLVFTGIRKVLLETDPAWAATTTSHRSAQEGSDLVVVDGRIRCLGDCREAIARARAQGQLGGDDDNDAPIIRLRDGCLAPALTAVGSTLGLNAVDAERDTDNGDDRGAAFSRAVDGLALDTRKLRAAARHGVTRAVSAPKFAGQATHHGTSAGFLTGAAHAAVDGAVFADDVAVHYTLDLAAKRADAGTPSLSAAVGRLRAKLLDAVRNATVAHDGADPFSEAAFLRKVVRGELPLAVTVHSADTIAAVLRVKEAVDQAVAAASTPSPSSSTAPSPPPKLRLVIVGGAESHLVARALAEADVAGVVLAPAFSYRTTWDQRRALTGAPLTNGTAVDVLADAGVRVALGLEEDWVVRDLGLLAGVAYANGGGRFSEKAALALVSGNALAMLGLPAAAADAHFVVHEGSPLETGSRVKAVADGTGRVLVF